MSVAVFSSDAVLARMLLLEALRCGLREADAAHAEVALVDLDHLPKGALCAQSPMRIGFSATPERYVESGMGFYAVLPLPFSAAALSALLCRREPMHTAMRGTGEVLWLSGKKIRLSKTEQRLLDLLLQNRDRVLTIEELNDALGACAENSNEAAVYLYRIRRKLEADGTKRIRTVRGVGYQWIGEDRIYGTTE